MNRIEMKSDYETVQILLHSDVADAQELVGGGHHVDAIRLTLSAFLVHELEHRVISWGALEDYAQIMSKRRKIALMLAGILAGTMENQ